MLSWRQILRGLLTAAAEAGPLRGSGAAAVWQRCGSSGGRALARPPPTREKVAESGEIEISPD